MISRKAISGFSVIVMILMASPSFAASQEYVFGFQKYRKKVYNHQEKLKSYLKSRKYVTRLGAALKVEKEVFKRRWKAADAQLKAAEWAIAQIPVEGSAAKIDAIGMLGEISKTLEPFLYSGQAEQLFIPATMKRCWKASRNSLYWLMSSGLYWGFTNIKTIAASTFGSKVLGVMTPLIAGAALLYPIFALVKDLVSCREIPPNTPMTTIDIAGTPGSKGLVRFSVALIDALGSNKDGPEYDVVTLMGGQSISGKTLTTELGLSLKKLRRSLKFRQKRDFKNLKKKIAAYIKEVAKGSEEKIINDKMEAVVKSFDDIPSSRKDDLETAPYKRGFYFALHRNIEMIRSHVIKPTKKNTNTNNPNKNDPNKKVPPKKGPKIDDDLSK